MPAAIAQPDQGEAAPQPASGNISEEELARLLNKSGDQTEQPAGQGEPPAEEPEPSLPETGDPDDAEPDADPADTEEPGEEPEGEEPEGDEPEEEEPEGEEPDGEDDSDPEAMKAAFEKRLGKVWARAKSAEAEVESLREEIAAMRQVEDQVRDQPLPMVSGNELGDVDSLTELDKRLSDAWAVRKWCLQHPDGGEVSDGQQTVDIDAETVAARLAEVDELIHRHAPARRDFLSARAENRRRLHERLPWTKDKTSPLYHQMQKILSNRPHMKQYADGEVEAAINVLGLQKLQELTQASPKAPKGTGRPARKPARVPKSPGRPGAAPRAAQPSNKVLAEKQQAFRQSGSVDDLQEVFAARRQNKG